MKVLGIQIDIKFHFHSQSYGIKFDEMLIFNDLHRN